jgi:DNA-directed RNA polymerase specialized sigma24 family protein
MPTMHHSNWQELFDALAALARKKLGHLQQQVANEEDIACSVLRSYFRGVEEGRFLVPQDDHFSLWPLLSLIAIRKCADLVAYLKAQKRDISRVTQAELDDIVGKAASPSSIVEHQERRQSWLDALPDEDLRQMAQWKMEGFTNKEIAAKLDRVDRSVERGLHLIREIWEKYLKKDESGAPRPLE